MPHLRILIHVCPLSKYLGPDGSTHLHHCACNKKNWFRPQSHLHQINLHLCVTTSPSVRMDIALRNKVETYQMFRPCHMNFFDGRVAVHMT